LQHLQVVGDCRADAEAAADAPVAVTGGGVDGCDDGGDRDAFAFPDEESGGDRELEDDVAPARDRCVGAKESSSNDVRMLEIESRSLGISNDVGRGANSDNDRPRPFLLPLLVGDSVSIRHR
jgi:hypothetical protein